MWWHGIAFLGWESWLHLAVLIRIASYRWRIRPPPTRYLAGERLDWSACTNQFVWLRWGANVRAGGVHPMWLGIGYVPMWVRDLILCMGYSLNLHVEDSYLNSSDLSGSTYTPVFEALRQWLMANTTKHKKTSLMDWRKSWLYTVRVLEEEKYFLKIISVIWSALKYRFGGSYNLRTYHICQGNDYIRLSPILPAYKAVLAQNHWTFSVRSSLLRRVIPNISKILCLHS